MAQKTKIDRIKVYEKYGQRCAYCGTLMDYKDMQVDHFWPQCLAHQEPTLDPNRFENLMPSCRKCNNHKHGMRPETWRREIRRHLDMLQNNTQFQRALRFNLVKITPQPVVFYYERFGPQGKAEAVEHPATRAGISAGEDK